MALEVIATISCDTCGNKAVSEPETLFGNSTRTAQELKWDLKKRGWEFASRGRYHREAHICPACLDKPMPVLKDERRKKMPPKFPCKIIMDHGTFLKHPDGRLERIG